jgi:chaperonin GroES
MAREKKQPTYAKVAGRKLEPMYDRLFVQRLAAVAQTEGDIFIPETAREKPAEGKILAVGPGRIDRDTGEHVPMQLKVGDYVLFGRYGGMEISFDDEKDTDVLILREDEILAREIGRADLGVRKLRVKR